jgi:hypothetical protein
MVPASLHASRTAIIGCLLLWGSSAFAQANQAGIDPPARPGDIAVPEPAAPVASAQWPVQKAQVSDQSALRAQAAQAVAVEYLNLWSAPNRLTLAAASSFYGSTVLFHGRERTLGSVLTEKRRFAERWPKRSYHYRPETTMVACERDGARCTVWAIFDFSAASSDQDRHSLGIGEHELVVNLSDGKPVIASETSRVLHRGAVRNQR